MSMQPNPTASVESNVRCPYCAEVISSAAKKCKHCGEFLDDALKQARMPIPGPTGLSGTSEGKSRIAAGLFAIFLGGIGVHKFYLGQTGQGIVYVLFCWTFIPSVIGFIEGILYLTMSDQAFADRYTLRTAAAGSLANQPARVPREPQKVSYKKGSALSDSPLPLKFLAGALGIFVALLVVLWARAQLLSFLPLIVMMGAGALLLWFWSRQRDRRIL